jgi:hypothetical protein
MANETHKFLLERKAELEAELAMIDAGLRAAGILPKEKPPRERNRLTVAASPTTLPDQILSVLKENPAGLTSQQAMEKVNEKYQRNLDRISCSSYLSKLKTSKLADYDENYVWTSK